MGDRVEVREPDKIEIREAQVARIEVALGGPQGLPGVDGEDGATGPQGPPGTAALGAFDRVPQETPSTHWVITHTLGFYPNVTTVDSAGNEVEGAISFPDISTVVIDFDVPFGGYANLS